MNEKYILNEQFLYSQAEERALAYFEELKGQYISKNYESLLVSDIEEWKKQHVKIFRPAKRFGNKDKQKYLPHIKKLERAGRLDSYLHRSVAYIYMRDLGKSLGDPEIRERVQKDVQDLKSHLLQAAGKENEGRQQEYTMAGLYRMAQKEGVEASLVWVMERIRKVAAMIPEGMDKGEAQRKLIKIIAGVLMHELQEMDEGIPAVKRKARIDRSIRLGYSYGLTYPFIDDLLDSNVLSKQEKAQYAALIETTLLTGNVPDLGVWAGEHKDLIHFIHAELGMAFVYIKDQQPPEKVKAFFEQSYVFFRSQELDRGKDLSDGSYTNEDIYLPIITKSASSRLIVRSVISAPEDEGFEKRTFHYGIYNQLADDFADMFDDLALGVVTPYTYYLTHHKERKDLINPFELYWTVISHLLHEVYQGDSYTREVILDRAINGLKRYKEKKGIETYRKVMEVFGSFQPTFNQMIERLVHKADNVDFFDKLLRDHIIADLKKDQQEQEKYETLIENVRARISSRLQLEENGEGSILKEPIMNAANYSLEGNGKRLRPVLAWVMGVDHYSLEESAIMPMLLSLEYMHTASLIFDDLPSQDNATMRRGRPTLHEAYSTSVAELTGLYLTQKATALQTSLEGFPPERVLHLIRYSAEATAVMCRGQAMDLGTKGEALTVDQLNAMCFYKTGKAFEASLVMPSILAGKEEKEIEALRKFAYHAGIAFQIKDDLLDIEGEEAMVGKNVRQDSENNNANFVAVLGVEEAKKAMWEHYCLAMDELRQMPDEIPFLKHFMNGIIHREK